MCFGGGGGDTNRDMQRYSESEALRARTDDRQRASRVRLGMDKIAAIFEGGRLPTLNRARGPYDPRQAYFTKDGSRWRPQSESKKGFLKPRKGAEAAKLFAEQMGDLFVRGRGARQAGMTPLVEARRDALRGFYIPQIERELGDTRDDLTFALARAGLGGSTMAEAKADDLNEGYNLERAGIIADIGRDIAGTRTAINDQRSALESQLRASGDASATTNAALASRSAFAADRPDLNPIGNVLASFAEGIGSAVNGFRSGQVRNTARGTASANRNLSRTIS